MCHLRIGARGKGNARLPVVGSAPEFALTTQSGERLSLTDLRGKVLAVTFIYATCKDTCPIVTAKMATLQHRLGTDFGARVRFVSVTVEPEVRYTRGAQGICRTFGAEPAGWSFLTGSVARSPMSCGATAHLQSGRSRRASITCSSHRWSTARHAAGPVPRLPLRPGRDARATCDSLLRE